MGCYDTFSAHIVCSKCKRKHEGEPWELQFKCFGRSMNSIFEGDDVRKLGNPPLKNDRYEDYMTCTHCGNIDNVDLVIRDYIYIGARIIGPKTYLVRLVEDIWYKMNKKDYLREHDANVDKEWLARLEDWGADPNVHWMKNCIHSCLL